MINSYNGMDSVTYPPLNITTFEEATMSKISITQKRFKSIFGEYFTHAGVLDDFSNDEQNSSNIAPMYGKRWKHTEESKAKMRAHIFTEEHKKNLSKNHADTSGKNHPMYGRKHSEEIREKISLAAIERYKDKTNHPMYGKKQTEEHKRKISLSLMARRVKYA